LRGIPGKPGENGAKSVVYIRKVIGHFTTYAYVRNFDAIAKAAYTAYALQGLEIGVMTADDESDYTALVDSAPNSPFTHTLNYRNVLRGSGMGDACYFVARYHGQLRAVLPAHVKHTAMGAVLNSLPLAQSAGGVIVSAEATADERTVVVRDLMDACLDYARCNKIGVCVFIGTPFGNEEILVSSAPDFVIDRETHVLDLTAPLHLHHAAQEGVRKACKSSPVWHRAHCEADAKMVWQLYADSMTRMNVVARPWPFYARLYACGEQAVRFVWCTINGEATSGFVLLCHKDVVDYHSVGNTSLGRTHQTNSWLCLHELREAAARGAKWWNWGASPTPAVAVFKRNFGGHDRTFRLRGFFTQDVSSWRQLSASDLAAHFPNYYVVPHRWLNQEAKAASI